MDEVVMLHRHAMILGGTGSTRNEVIKSKLPELLNKNVNLFTVPMITIEEIETHSRLAALRKPINVIVVDYVNLVTMKKRGESNSLDQNEIAKRLAALALDLNCTVIGLLQVNRASNNRPVGERIPQVADAADSMGSVKSATWWIGIDQPQKDDPDPTFRDLYQLACRKNRHGDNFYIDFDFKNGMFFKRETTFQQYASQKPMREHVYSPFKT
jgi:replicative DNA helicase